MVEAQLVLLRVEPGHGETPVESTDTDRAGRFRIPPVPLGAYVLDVRADGFDTLRYAFALTAPVGGLMLRLDPTTEDATHLTFVYAPTALPGDDGTSTSTLSAKEIQSLPGGTTRSLNDVIATQPGITRDNYGAIHVRGNFAGLALRVDDIPLPPSVQDRLQQLLGSQIVEHAEVIVGGLPAEFGESVAGVVDIQTRRPGPKPDGELLLAYGTYNQVEGQASGAGRFGPLSVVAAASLGTTERGLDPPAASPILHDRLRAGRAFVSADDRLSSTDHLRLLMAYGESHYQIPIDPTLLPLSAAPPGAVRAGDPYGNDPPDFVPYNANPTEDERDLFAALSWFHDFGPRATLQIAPFVRYERSSLSCDPAGALGATADPGQTCSDVLHHVVQGGAVVNQTIGVGRHDLKAGLLFDDQRSTVGYAQYFRDDASPEGGADPTADPLRPGPGRRAAGRRLPPGSDRARQMDAVPRRPPRSLARVVRRHHQHAGRAERPPRRLLRGVAGPAAARLRRVPLAAAHLRRADRRPHPGRGPARLARSPTISAPSSTATRRSASPRSSCRSCGWRSRPGSDSRATPSTTTRWATPRSPPTTTTTTGAPPVWR